MTAHRDEHGPDNPSDRDLTRLHEAFTAKVANALDVEAGLHDILFQSQHEAFTAKVDNAVDVEAGLRDILTPSPVQAPPSLSPPAVPPVTNTAPGDSKWPASPAQRLKLRGNPRVMAVRSVLRAVESWTGSSARDLTFARNLDRNLHYDLTLDRDLARNLTRELTCDLFRDRILARRLTRASRLTRNLGFARNLNLAHNLARNLTDARNLAQDFNRNRKADRARDLLFTITRDLASALDHNLGLDPDRTRDDDLVIGLSRARDLVSALDLDLNPGLDPDRDIPRARAHAYALVLILVLVLALDLVLDRARYRSLHVIKSEYAQAIGTPVAVDEESLASLMDDFTTDDLSDADVQEGDAKLAGVRWSDGTTWPASTDINYLKRRSDRQKDGSWIIRAGTGTVRENVLT